MSTIVVSTIVVSADLPVDRFTTANMQLFLPTLGVLASSPEVEIPTTISDLEGLTVTLGHFADLLGMVPVSGLVVDMDLVICPIVDLHPTAALVVIVVPLCSDRGPKPDSDGGDGKRQAESENYP
jgi:hypothetical protein